MTLTNEILSGRAWPKSRAEAKRYIQWLEEHWHRKYWENPSEVSADQKKAKMLIERIAIQYKIASQ